MTTYTDTRTDRTHRIPYESALRARRVLREIPQALRAVRRADGIGPGLHHDLPTLLYTGDLHPVRDLDDDQSWHDDAESIEEAEYHETDRAEALEVWHGGTTTGASQGTTIHRGRSGYDPDTGYGYWEWIDDTPEELVLEDIRSANLEFWTRAECDDDAEAIESVRQDLARALCADPDASWPQIGEIARRWRADALAGMIEAWARTHRMDPSRRVTG